MTVSLNHLGDLARKRVAVAVYYFVPGVVFASWASRIPDVKQMLHLSNGQLGTVLFAIPIGQLLMMAFSGVLVSKFGSRKMILLAEVFYAFVLFCIGSSSTVFQLILSLVAFGMMANLMNIATNTQACLVEKMYGRNIMSSFHGLWSLGGFSGGIIGAVFANTQLPIEAHLGAVLVMTSPKPRNSRSWRSRLPSLYSKAVVMTGPSSWIPSSTVRADITHLPPGSP